jgi:hypothetical protein
MGIAYHPSGGVAQLVEQRTHKPRVSRSIRDTATKPHFMWAADLFFRREAQEPCTAPSLQVECAFATNRDEQGSLSAAPACEYLPLLRDTPAAFAEFNG